MATSTITRTPLVLPEINLNGVLITGVEKGSKNLPIPQKTQFFTAGFGGFFNPHDIQGTIPPLKIEMGDRHVGYLHATQVDILQNPQVTIELHVALFAENSSDLRTTLEKVIQAVNKSPCFKDVRAFRVTISEKGASLFHQLSSYSPPNLQWREIDWRVVGNHSHIFEVSPSLSNPIDT